MALTILKNAKVYLGGHDISGDLNQIDVSYEAKMQEVTVFGDTTQRFMPGLCTFKADHQGYVQSGGSDTPPLLIEDILWANLATAGTVLTYSPTTGAVGEPAYTIKSVQGDYTPGAKVGDLLSFGFTVAGSAGGPLVRGTVFETGAKTATPATSGTIQLGAVSATQKLYASLHVLALSGTSPTLDLDIRSDDNSGWTSPVSRITFAQFNAIGASHLSLAGPITDTYWKAYWTIGGSNTPSVTFVIVVGIQ